MPSRQAGQWVLWPHYFDSEVSRGQGRRVPTDLATASPRTQDVAKAARSLGLKVEVLDDARHPRRWHTSKGCVVVIKTGEPKDSVLKQVARRL